jgi:hypothetical protein
MPCGMGVCCLPQAVDNQPIRGFWEWHASALARRSGVTVTSSRAVSPPRVMARSLVVGEYLADRAFADARE